MKDRTEDKDSPPTKTTSNLCFSCDLSVAQQTFFFLLTFDIEKYWIFFLILWLFILCVCQTSAPIPPKSVPISENIWNSFYKGRDAYGPWNHAEEFRHSLRPEGHFLLFYSALLNDWFIYLGPTPPLSPNFRGSSWRPHIILVDCWIFLTIRSHVITP